MWVSTSAKLLRSLVTFGALLLDEVPGLADSRQEHNTGAWLKGRGLRVHVISSRRNGEYPRY